MTLFPRVYVYIATRGLQQGLEFSHVRQLGSVRDHGELSVCIYHVGYRQRRQTVGYRQRRQTTRAQEGLCMDRLLTILERLAKNRFVLD